MSKKRRLIGFILIFSLIMVMALAACGGDDEKEETPEPTATVEPTEEPTEEPTDEECGWYSVKDSTWVDCTDPMGPGFFTIEVAEFATEEVGGLVKAGRVITASDPRASGHLTDWKDPDTYLWFTPGHEGVYGRVSFGFGNLWPQGGMNDQGLFFDGMMTEPLPLKKTEGKPPPHDLLDRMLRECATVDEAVKFLDQFHMPQLANAMLFLGDKHGNSAIYEGDEVLRGDGRLQVVTNYYQSRQTAQDVCRC